MPLIEIIASHDDDIALNLMYGYRFDFLLAFITMLTWIKAIFMFRVTLQFGPMFKIIFQMVHDLIKFLISWTVVQVSFSCVSILLF